MPEGVNAWCLGVLLQPTMEILSADTRLEGKKGEMYSLVRMQGTADLAARDAGLAALVAFNGLTSSVGITRETHASS